MTDNQKLKDVENKLNDVKEQIINAPITSIATGKEGNIVDINYKNIYLSFMISGSIPVSIDKYKNLINVDSNTVKLIDSYLNLIDERNKLKKGGKK